MNKFIVIILLIVYMSGCTSCHQQLISSASSKHWSADVNFRVCGSVSGYVVAIYKKGEKPPGQGEGDLEPFKATYLHTSKVPKIPSPVNIKWVDDTVIEIMHKTKETEQDNSSDLVVIKADPKYADVTIKYNHLPILWQ